ncbi:CgeB family protein [Microvirga subterranea]|uniref:Spore maturation protein CgeB n=1 Tax=Microvirga subterranea TaxID=186651 RepID=A0A370HLF6_9HYPH|nr:glycosyltransferase [Microvirga subterranea]RDI59329.1 spore maturation protein CgeB [Microvirga subterranea]
MKIVVFGLTISSSWGNGHATLWRGLCRALARLGHQVVFFERDVPYYAMNRDLHEVPGGTLVLYDDWAEALPRAKAEIKDADAVMVTSYCPDGIAAGELVLGTPRAKRVFYDLDTPVTLSRLKSQEGIGYIGPQGLKDYDLVLSYTGGAALEQLRSELGARRVEALYGHVDPDHHRPVPPQESYRSDLSYLGTYATDRQATLHELFIEPAQFRPDLRFVIGGAQYPQDFPWLENIFFVQHLPPSEHPSFFCSSRLTLNVTRSAMAEMGWCPSGRLFEAAACGVPLLSDSWPGIDSFFSPGQEILIARTTEDALNALDMSDAELSQVAKAGRERVLEEHTSMRRAQELETFLSTGDPASTANHVRDTVMEA